MFTVEVKMIQEQMNDYGFYTAEQLKELDDSDLSFEISEVALINNEQANSYLKILIEELQRRNTCTDYHEVEKL